MRTLAFDGRTGASGDMILAALVAAGGDPDVLAAVEDALGVEYRIGETTSNGIHATTVDVRFDSGADGSHGTGSDHDRHHHNHEHGHASDHTHDHAHSHEHDHGEDDTGDRTHDHEDDHSHDHTHNHDDHTHSHDDHAHDHAEGSGPNRTYAECRDIVAEMGLPSSVETNAIAIFRLLGEAEARVHGTDLEETHFHEVGADDAIADIVGSALLLADLDVDRVVTTSVAAGGGEVSMSHGVYPVPAPAVSYIAAEASWVLAGGPIETELLTPTGAAILAHIADGVDSLPPASIEAVGYGAGDRSFDDRPNVLRATVGESEGRLVADDIRVLETSVDDATPETLGGLHDRLADAGARDVTILPATMKKSRPGHLIQVVVKPKDVATVAKQLAAETGSLGIRETAVEHRWIAERSFETVELGIDGDTHEVSVKIATDGAGDVYDVSAEYDNALTVAERADLPVKEIMRRAETVYRQRE